MTEFVTHDLKRFILEKPHGYRFIPGQATDIVIDMNGWNDKKHPFTFTSLNDDRVLEFIIKSYPRTLYPKHEGMTEKLHTLKPGDNLLIDKPWGTINYKGPGIFIAGGAGITPFIAIFRNLTKEDKIRGNTLIFSNKRSEDVILEKELRYMFGPDNLFLTLTREKKDEYLHGRIDKIFIKNYLNITDTNFYICGPKIMVSELKDILGELGIKSNSVVFEE